MRGPQAVPILICDRARDSPIWLPGALTEVNREDDRGLIKIKAIRVGSSYPDLWPRGPRDSRGTTGQGSGEMAGNEGSGRPDQPERVPVMQRVLDNPFLLLFLGVTIPTVFYILWGVMELTQVPVAR
jgi:hypothetical protein